MNTRRAVIFSAVLMVLLLAAVTVLAQGGYDLSWFTVDSGGGTSQSSGGPAAYTLSGTLGQPDSGTMSGGGYDLSGGFWSRAGPTQFVLRLPLVAR